MGGKKELHSEKDLRSKKNNDNYYIQKIFKFSLLSVVCFVLFGACWVFISKIVNDVVFQEKLVDEIVSSFDVIFVAILSILGISYNGAGK